MGRILFPLGLLLQIVDLAEEIVAGRPQFHRGQIGETEDFQRVPIDPALNILIADTANFDLPVHPLVSGGTIII